MVSGGDPPRVEEAISYSNDNLFKQSVADLIMINIVHLAGLTQHSGGGGVVLLSLMNIKPLLFSPNKDDPQTLAQLTLALHASRGAKDVDMGLSTISMARTLKLVNVGDKKICGMSSADITNWILKCSWHPQAVAAYSSIVSEAGATFQNDPVVKHVIFFETEDPSMYAFSGKDTIYICHRRLYEEFGEGPPRYRGADDPDQLTLLKLTLGSIAVHEAANTCVRKFTDDMNVSLSKALDSSLVFAATSLYEAGFIAESRLYYATTDWGRNGIPRDIALSILAAFEKGTTFPPIPRQFITPRDYRYLGMFKFFTDGFR